MKVDIRKQAVTQSLIKDNSSDWKNIANREIQENEKLQEKIDLLEKKLTQKDNFQILDINPIKCCNWKYADRNSFELGDIQELAEDIKTNGQLQPAIVRKITSEDYDYEVIAGERRWRACLRGDLNLKAIITEEDEAGCLVIQNSENKKKSLSAYSLAISYHRLMSDLNISQNELSRRLNIPKTSFSELLSFNKVPKEVWEAVQDMSKVKPKTAAFLALICRRDAAHLNAIIQLAPRIREGYGTDNLLKLIEKFVAKRQKSEITEAPLARKFENKNGDMLFRVSASGKISLSKDILEKLDWDKFSDYLTKYFE